jgi:hypothetical protein
MKIDNTNPKVCGHCALYLTIPLGTCAGCGGRFCGHLLVGGTSCSTCSIKARRGSR